MPPIPIREFEARLPALVALLRRFAELESPTTQKEAVDAFGAAVAEELERHGAEVERLPQDSVGDLWIGRWGAGAGGLLLLTHLDTVHALGTLGTFPILERDGRLFGPGVLDMKASFAMGLTAIAALREKGAMRGERLTWLCTSDEETSSRTARPVILDLAERHDRVLCLEPALPNGALKTHRKGVGLYRIEAQGRAAHAGSEPEEGVNAILEMAQQALQISRLADPARGTTVNVGVIQGGTRSNVVPEICRARVDIRVETLEEAGRLEEAFLGLRPLTAGASLRVEGGLNRPPMVRTPAIARAFARAQEIGAQLGLALTEGGTGGGSDANFLAHLDKPLLDGLGAVGEGAHSDRENVQMRSLVERTALLAALISEW
ncbi:MAG TPA: M20 family metallopeptidase [Anaerolineales bacterium]|nr:M20 family metallopeptidase [Anaerolineales bacterium]